MNASDLGFSDFVNLIIEALNKAGVEYMIGGALAVWVWGEPRMTLDVDLVVSIPIEAVPELSRELKLREMLVPEDIILDRILDEQGDVPINAIHPYIGLKAELFILREGDELRQSAFARRRVAGLGGQIGEVYVHSPEDLIIYKLWYFSLSQQSKHIRDIVSILRSRPEELDYEYLGEWLSRMNLDSLWDEMQAHARTSDI